MVIFGTVPTYVVKLFEKKGVNPDELYLLTYCDMGAEHTFCDTYIAATGTELLVLSGRELLLPTQRGKGLETAFTETEFHRYSLESLDKIKVEELISSSRLVATDTGAQNIGICAMTNFCKANANCFVKYLMKIKKGEIASPDFEIDKEDDPKKNCCPKCGMRYPDSNRKICPKCMEKGKLFLRFGEMLLRYKRELVILLVSLLVLTGAAILTPYFSKGFFFDSVLTEGGDLYGQVLLCVGIVVATQLLSRVADMVNGYISTKIAAKIVYDLKNTIFGAIEKLSMSFFGARQTGGLMTQVNDDSNTIYGFFCDGVPYFLINIVQVVVLSVILFCMNPLLAFLSLITVPLFFVALRKSFTPSKKLHARVYSGTRSMNSQLSDVLGGIRVVKAFSKEDAETVRFTRANKRAAGGKKRLSLFNNYVYPSLAYLLYFGNVIALGVGGYMVMRGTFTYGELLTFTAYINMIYSPMFFFSHMFEWAASCSNALQRLYEIYDTVPDITEKPDALSPDTIEGTVEFRGVDLGTPSPRKSLTM